MKLAKRIIAVVGAPALLAGFMLAGSAAASPSKSNGPSLPYSVAFTATVITGTTTFTIDSTSCTLTGKGGTAHSCFLGGSGTLPTGTSPATADFSVTGSAFGPVSVSLTEETANCGDGSAVLIRPTGNFEEPAKVTLDNTVIQTSANTFIIKGTLKVGPAVSTCKG